MNAGIVVYIGGDYTQLWINQFISWVTVVIFVWIHGRVINFVTVYDQYLEQSKLISANLYNLTYQMYFLFSISIKEKSCHLVHWGFNINLFTCKSLMLHITGWENANLHITGREEEHTRVLTIPGHIWSCRCEMLSAVVYCVWNDKFWE